MAFTPKTGDGPLNQFWYSFATTGPISQHHAISVQTGSHRRSTPAYTSPWSRTLQCDVLMDPFYITGQFLLVSWYTLIYRQPIKSNYTLLHLRQVAFLPLFTPQFIPNPPHKSRGLPATLRALVLASVHVLKALPQLGPPLARQQLRRRHFDRAQPGVVGTTGAVLLGPRPVTADSGVGKEKKLEHHR